MHKRYFTLAAITFALWLGIGLAAHAQAVVPTKTIATGQTTTTLLVTWTAPTANTDGTPISSTLTYNAYWAIGPCAGITPGSVMNTTPITTLSYTVTNVGPGDKCFGVTAVENGIESAQAPIPPFEIVVAAAPVVVVKPTPAPPSNVSVK